MFHSASPSVFRALTHDLSQPLSIQASSATAAFKTLVKYPRASSGPFLSPEVLQTAGRGALSSGNPAVPETHPPKPPCFPQYHSYPLRCRTGGTAPELPGFVWFIILTRNERLGLEALQITIGLRCKKQAGMLVFRRRWFAILSMSQPQARCGVGRIFVDLTYPVH